MCIEKTVTSSNSLFTFVRILNGLVCNTFVRKVIKSMRIDKFLKVSRIIKRRTVANEACDAGRVLVNDKVVKASYDVKVNDIIQIQFGQRTVKVQVLNLNETVKKEAAAEMYKDLS